MTKRIITALTVCALAASAGARAQSNSADDCIEMLAEITTFQAAVDAENIDAAQCQVEMGLNVNGKAKDEWRDDEVPLLIYALRRRGASEFASLLLKNGADVDAKYADKNGSTFLHYAARNSVLEMAERLLKDGADVHAKNSDGYTPLHRAASGNALEIAELLLKSGADVHAKNSDGYTPLHSAAINHARATAELLLQNGGDVNAKDDDGDTPLHWAAGKNAIITAVMLLKNGADVHAKNGNGETPLHWAASLYSGYDEDKDEWFSFRYVRAPKMAELLLENGAEADLWIAARLNDTEIARRLIADGADVNAKDDDGYTPLHWAAEINSRNLAVILILNGADVNSETNKFDTPLHHAAQFNSIEMAELLLKNRANVNAKGYENQTPLHVAAYYGAIEMAELLLKNRANVNAKGGGNNASPLEYALYYTHRNRGHDEDEIVVDKMRSLLHEHGGVCFDNRGEKYDCCLDRNFSSCPTQQP